MKHTRAYLILTAIIIFQSMTVQAQPPQNYQGQAQIVHPLSQALKQQNMRQDTNIPPQFGQQREADRETFAKRLGLTEEQKQTLDRQRQEDMKEIKPILEEMTSKRHEFSNIMNSNIPQIEKEAKLLKLKSEMKDLKTKADEKRSQNMKRFESVLTEEQKAEFQKIKAEGKQRHTGAHGAGFSHEHNRASEWHNAPSRQF